MRIPSFAPRPVPTMRAVGVASPSAHGQAMITTATANSIAVAASAPSSTNQTTNVRIAMMSTAGTNMFDILSTVF